MNESFQKLKDQVKFLRGIGNRKTGKKVLK